MSVLCAEFITGWRGSLWFGFTRADFILTSPLFSPLLWFHFLSKRCEEEEKKKGHPKWKSNKFQRPGQVKAAKRNFLHCPRKKKKKKRLAD